MGWGSQCQCRQSRESRNINGHRIVCEVRPVFWMGVITSSKQHYTPQAQHQLPIKQICIDKNCAIQWSSPTVTERVNNPVNIELHSHALASMNYIHTDTHVRLTTLQPLFCNRTSREQRLGESQTEHLTRLSCRETSCIYGWSSCHTHFSPNLKYHPLHPASQTHPRRLIDRARIRLVPVWWCVSTTEAIHTAENKAEFDFDFCS